MQTLVLPLPLNDSLMCKEQGFQQTTSDTVPAVPAAQLIAFYLPQFHPIPENDVWWGKGFTEWTNVAKARPLFRGHYQPHVPADLGFYDLRVPEVRAAQADMARSAGIEGFCYWHYWFGGRRILERPFNEVLKLKEPDFPFCLAWANHSWTGVWHGAPNQTLIEQVYPGRADYENHFYAIVEAFHDQRYIRVQGKPVFVVFQPTDLPHPGEFIELWQSLAVRTGLPGIHFVANLGFHNRRYDYRAAGFAAKIAGDMLTVNRLNAWQRALAWYQASAKHNSGVEFGTLRFRALARAIRLKARKQVRYIRASPTVVEYTEAMVHFLRDTPFDSTSYPCVMPNWDHSPRAGRASLILHNSTPELFREHLRNALQLVAHRPIEDRIVFVKSWNEWAEGNYLEPDLKYGQQFLDVVRDEVMCKPLRGLGRVSKHAACAA
jgi:lipopolysaccharide biosynthesis protein